MVNLQNRDKSIDILSGTLYKYRNVAAVAQSVEQRTENPRVNSSILFGGTKAIFIGWSFLMHKSGKNHNNSARKRESAFQNNYFFTDSKM